MIRYLLYRFFPYYLVLLLLIGGALLLSSETGLQLIWKQLQTRLPENLKITQVHGQILGRIHLKGIAYESEQLDFNAREAWLQWTPASLFQGLIQLDDITLIGANIKSKTTSDVPATEPSAPPQELPGFPKILVKKLQVIGFEYWLDDQSKFLLSRAKLNARYQQRQLDLHVVEFNSRETGALLLQVDADILAKRLELRRLKISRPDAQTTAINLTGSCSWPQLDCLAALNWQDLQWPIQDQAQWQSQRGQAELTWTKEQKQLQLSSQIGGHHLPESQLGFSANWAAEQGHWLLDTNWQQQDKQNTNLRVNAQFNPQQSKLQGQARLQGIDLESWLQDWPSQLSGILAFEAQMQPQLAVTLSDVKLDGSIRKQVFKLRAKGAYTPSEWQLGSLNLLWEENRLSGNLKRGSTWNGQLQLAANNLQALDDELAGKVDLAASVTGNGKWPHLKWQAKASDLRWRDVQLTSFQSDGLFSDKVLKIGVLAEQLEAASLSLHKLKLNSTGRPENIVTQIDALESRGSLKLKVASQWNEKTKTLVAKLSNGLIQSQFGAEPHDWLLDNNAQIRWENQVLVAESLCWRSSDTALCAQARIDRNINSIEAQAELSNYPFERLRSQLPVGSRLEGSANAKLQISPSALDNPKLDLEFSTSQLNVIRTLADDEIELLRFDPGILKAQLQDKALVANWSFPLAESGKRRNQDSGFWGQGTVSKEQSLDLKTHLNFDDIGVIAAFIPEILQASGPLEGEIALRGPAKQAELDAHLSLGPAEISLDQPNLKLRDFKLNIDTLEDQKIQIRGDMHSGEGKLSLNGFFSNWMTQPQFNTELQGDNFQVLDTAEARIAVSPNIKLVAQLPDIKIRGSVLVNEADIHPRDLSQSGAIAPVEDQIIVGEELAPDQKLKIDSELSLLLGDKVRIEAMGLSSDIRGKLSTRLKPGKVTTAVGKLSLVNGRYKAYGQDLRIEKGELIFSGGPVTEPGLDLKAYRQARADVRAGVIVRGPIRNPSVSLYSDPNMRETDQLSYLVLGRAAEAQSDEDQAALNNAALALGLKGSDLLAKRFKSQLGLDEVSIGSQAGENSSQASLVLGKYLSPDIYVSYGVGLFEPVYTFKLRYQISRHWTLQTESGVESGGDLFYTIER